MVLLMDKDPQGKWIVNKIVHIAKSAIFENNRLTIGQQKNAIQNFYNLLLTEFRLMRRG